MKSMTLLFVLIPCLLLDSGQHHGYLANILLTLLGFLGDSVAKNPPADAGEAGDMGLIPGSGISPGEGNGNRLQYSCLENLMDRGAWQATIRRVAKSFTRLKRLSIHTHTQSHLI